jgi:hypothetical protein
MTAVVAGDFGVQPRRAVATAAATNVVLIVRMTYSWRFAGLRDADALRFDLCA